MGRQSDNTAPSMDMCPESRKDRRLFLEPLTPGLYFEDKFFHYFTMQCYTQPLGGHTRKNPEWISIFFPLVENYFCNHSHILEKNKLYWYYIPILPSSNMGSEHINVYLGILPPNQSSIARHDKSERPESSPGTRTALKNRKTCSFLSPAHLTLQSGSWVPGQ